MEFKADLINDILFHSINNSWVGELALCWHICNVEQTLKYYIWLTRMTWQCWWGLFLSVTTFHTHTKNKQNC